MEEEIDRRRRDEGKKMTSTTVVLNRRLVAASAMEGELRRGRGWSVWSGEETVRGATSPDDGVPTYGIYSAAARAGVVLVLWCGLSGACFELAVGLDTYY